VVLVTGAGVYTGVAHVNIVVACVVGVVTGAIVLVVVTRSVVVTRCVVVLGRTVVVVGAGCGSTKPSVFVSVTHHGFTVSGGCTGRGTAI
jgi:hypothetical protein